ncbi:MAG: DUF5312 domain-containing protein [Treponema sp.]|jgi:predicted transcriptional regulator|nr:DUF5312 domain-containing protein [Treponema sp.]
MSFSFFNKLQKIFSSIANPRNKMEVEKKKLLKMVTRDIAQSRYKKFYKPKLEEIDGEVGKFFYNIYKNISKAQIFMKEAANSSQLKVNIIESFMDKKQVEATEKLSKTAIEARSKTTPPQQLANEVKKELESFFAVFSVGTIRQINDCYNTILRFINFVSFDFYGIVKKFDRNISEHNFIYKPQFSNVPGEYICEQLKDFMEVAYAMDMNQDWKRAIKILNAYKDTEIINIDQWHKLLTHLHDIQSSSILLLITRLVDKNPVLQVKPNIPNQHIVEGWLEEKRTDTQEAIEKIINAKKDAAIGSIVRDIFGQTEISTLQYYTKAVNEDFIKKKLDGFSHTQELAYLKTFLLEIFKKELRPLCDIFLIKGQWQNQMLSQQMSDAIYRLGDIYPRIEAFDMTLALSGDYGDKLRIYVSKAEKEKSHVKYANNLFKMINITAQDIINDIARFLIIIGKFLKTFIDDKQKPLHDFIMNWKEIESASEVPILERLEMGYKKIYSMVKLLQIFSNPIDTKW